MSKEMRNAANFRAALTVMVVSAAVVIMIKKYTK